MHFRGTLIMAEVEAMQARKWGWCHYYNFFYIGLPLLSVNINVDI